MTDPMSTTPVASDHPVGSVLTMGRHGPVNRRAPVPAEHLVHGLDSPVVLIPGRVAAWLLSRAGLNEYHRGHRGDDPEVDQLLVALKIAAHIWRERNVGTGHGTRAADTPAQPAPSPNWLTTTAAARSLGIGTRAVRKAISAGRLRATWAGGCWWINAEDFEHFRARRAA